MRAPILIAGALLMLAGCRNNAQSDNSQRPDESLTADQIVSNDVTAIDAVTADAANMAADVDLNFGGLDESGNNATSSDAAAKPARPVQKNPAPRPQSNAADEASQPVVNSE